MKTRLLPCLALATFALAAQRVSAYEVPVEMNRANIKTLYPFFSVRTVHDNFGTNDDMIDFRIVVMPKGKHEPDDFSGVLTVKSGEKYIAMTELQRSPNGGFHVYPDIPRSLMAKSVEFEFYVSTKYLSTSEVKLKEGRSGGPSYLFKLKEFAPDK